MTGSVLFFTFNSRYATHHDLSPIGPAHCRLPLAARLSLSLSLSVSVSQFLYALYIIFLSTRRFRCVAPPPQLLSLAELRWDGMGKFKRNWEKTLRLKEMLDCSVWLWLYVIVVLTRQCHPKPSLITSHGQERCMHNDQCKSLQGWYQCTSEVTTLWHYLNCFNLLIFKHTADRHTCTIIVSTITPKKKHKTTKNSI